MITTELKHILVGFTLSYSVEVTWIFLAGGRVVIEGTLRGPRGPKKCLNGIDKILPQNCIFKQ